MIKFHPHAQRQLMERNISSRIVEKILLKPDEIVETEIKSRKIAHKILKKSGKKFLYRVVYTEQNNQKLVITVYRTTKIDKYFRRK